MSNWLDTLYKCQEKLLQMSGRLELYSTSFYITGNYEMGERMNNMSLELEKLTDQIEKATGEVVTENLNRAKENSTNVLKACLAGIEVATKENKDD